MPLTEAAKQSRKAAAKVATDQAIERATKKAEADIRAILNRLERDTMLSVEAVSVDTRNFGQLSTEIYLTTKARM